MSGLIKTIGSLFDPVLNFFEQIWNSIVFVFSFTFDGISGFYYGFVSLISNFWSSIENFFNLINTRSFNFVQGYGAVWNGISQIIGVGYASVFVAFFSVVVLYYCVKFIFSLIPFFSK